jgi:ribosomal peptide maturation radical SAM protein 1
MHDIVLVVPPFRQVYMPALGVSQLKSVLVNAGSTCQVMYANMYLAQSFGIFYEMICEDQPTSEFLFSGNLFDRTKSETEDIFARLFHENRSAAAPQRRYEDPLTDLRFLLKRFLPGASLRTSISTLICIAERVIHTVVDRVLNENPMIVGVSSMSSDICASLAIIKEVKKRRPEITTIIGGPNCLGDMGAEMLSSFSYIDFVAQGEAELSLVALVRDVKTYKKENPPKGILGRAKQGSFGSACSSSSEVINLDDLPFPDFDDYFDQLPKKHLIPRDMIRLPFETSRGCVWKVVKGCTFCSFHHASSVRKKSAARILAELDDTLARYPASNLYCIDLILESDRFRSVLPKLAGDKRIKTLVLESTGGVPRRRVKQLADSHVSFFQPGIETLSPSSLRLMNKPTTVPKNLQTLKWCAEKNIMCGWNYLAVIPGENPLDVLATASFVRNIHHLQPPVRGPHQIAIQRFSLYFQFPDEYGFEGFEVPPWMRLIFPLPLHSLYQLTYTFHSPQLDMQAAHPAYAVLTSAIREWHHVWNRSYLVAVPTIGCLFVLDTRPVRSRWWYCLRGAEREIYELCDKAQSLAKVKTFIKDRKFSGDAKAILDNLVANRIMVNIDNRYLSIALMFRPDTTLIRTRYNEIEFSMRDLNNFGKLFAAGFLKIVTWKIHLIIMKARYVGIPQIKSQIIVTLISVFARLAYMLAPKNSKPEKCASKPYDL